MNTGKTLFAQLMDFLPWTTFTRLVEQHGGDRYVKVLACTEQFRVMAFAQLTYRESLRDIEVCLSAQAAKLYHMGFRHEIKRSTLADANETRDWRIYAEFAQRLVAQARALYAGDSFGVELDNTAYALDSTTIDLCLSLFPWAVFRTTKSAVKMHTLLDLRGNIPRFIHLSDGKQGDVKVLDILVLEPGAFYIMDRGYLDFGRLYLMHQALACFVTRAKSNTRFRRLYSALRCCINRNLLTIPANWHDAGRFHRPRQPVPYKHHEHRRHKFTKPKYKVTNWPDYNEALRRRGDITIRFSEDAINDWRPAKTGARGRPQEYSDVAIETAVFVRQVLHLPLRRAFLGDYSARRGYADRGIEAVIPAGKKHEGSDG
jgi:hypothetical protein